MKKCALIRKVCLTIRVYGITDSSDVNMQECCLRQLHTLNANVLLMEGHVWVMGVHILLVPIANTCQ